LVQPLFCPKMWLRFLTVSSRADQDLMISSSLDKDQRLARFGSPKAFCSIKPLV